MIEIQLRVDLCTVLPILPMKPISGYVYHMPTFFNSHLLHTAALCSAGILMHQSDSCRPQLTDLLLALVRGVDEYQ